MNNIILFGFPGAGKSYIGSLLRDTFGYYFIEGDTFLPQSMLSALNTNTPITDEMRDEFMDVLIGEYNNAIQTYDKVVLSQTFLQDRHRTRFQHNFPETLFLLVEAPDPMREIRYMDRKSLSFNVEYLRKMVSLFEPITVPYHRIYNENEGTQEIIQQLQLLGIKESS